MNKRYFKSLMIEPTNLCNLHCPICPTGVGYFDDKAKGAMPFKQFKDIVDSTKDFITDVNLWGYGEPFLAPDIMPMINYLGGNNILINIHTNANILTEKMMEQFKNNYRVNITFSIDGLSQKTYEYYRVGGNLKKALSNLSYLVKLKKMYNLFNLRIYWQFLVMRVNEHEITKVQKLAQKIGVDILKLKTISIGKNNSQYNDFIPKKSIYRRLRKQDKNSPSCSFIDPGTPNITWDGEVVPCCIDYRREYVMGNAFKDNLLDIWNNEKYIKFRNDYKKGVNKKCNDECSFDKFRVYAKEIDLRR
jgi:radical SAM protein with 4Fe4S-binding SPASM domain